MRSLTGCLLAVIGLLVMNAYCETFKKTGMISDILVSPSATQDLAIFYVEGFSVAGVCATHSGLNQVLLSVPSGEQGNAMFSMLLAAYMANQPVNVTVSDNYTSPNGHCRVQYLRFK